MSKSNPSKDKYCLKAAQMFGIAPEQVTVQQRYWAKETFRKKEAAERVQQNAALVAWAKGNPITSGRLRQTIKEARDQIFK